MKKRRRERGEFTNFKERFKERFCSECNSKKTQVTITKNGYPHTKWVSNKNGGHLCHKCAKKILYRQNEIDRSKKRLKFKNKVAFLTFVPKKGWCSICDNNIFDASCKATQMHHWVYVTIFPWFGTEEICASCHGKETRRLEKLKKQFNSS